MSRPVRTAKSMCINSLVKVISYLNDSQSQDILDKKRKRENCETAEERHQRLSQMRKRTNNRSAEETVEQRDQRLEQMRERISQRRAQET